MARTPSTPRKPATKFPHLKKQMQKNAVPKQIAPKTYGPQGKKPHGAP
jgi:hypothetical protein